MTLGSFTDAAYTLVVRSFAAIPGKSLFDAIEETNAAFEITPPDTLIEKRNEESLKQLERMMSRV